MMNSDEQAVLIYLDGKSLPDTVYQHHDLATLEDELIAAINRDGIGEFDGNEIGPSETILFLYASNAEKLYKAIEPILRANPLCQNAKIVIRSGGPGTSVTEFLLPRML